MAWRFTGRPAISQQPLAERPERRRREWMRLAERRRVDAGNVEVAEQHHHVATHEGDVEVARSRSVRIEWLPSDPYLCPVTALPRRITSRTAGVPSRSRE